VCPHQFFISEMALSFLCFPCVLMYSIPKWWHRSLVPPPGMIYLHSFSLSVFHTAGNSFQVVVCLYLSALRPSLGGPLDWLPLPMALFAGFPFVLPGDPFRGFALQQVNTNGPSVFFALTLFKVMGSRSDFHFFWG